MNVKRYDLIEVAVAANAGAITIPILDQPDLRDDTTQDIIITGLETFPSEVLPATADANAVATLAQLKNSFLVLYIDGEESVYRVPMIRLLPVFANTLAAPGTLANFDGFVLENVRIVWNKSYIQLATPFGNNAAFSFLIGVRYKKLDPGTWDTYYNNYIQSHGLPPGF